MKVSVVSCFISLLIGALPGSLPGGSDLTIGLASELTFTTEEGRIYQMERSPDSSTWVRFGPWWVGDGSPLQAFGRIENNQGFFRVVDQEVTLLDLELETLRAERQLPALATVVLRDGRLSAAGATGMRRFGINAPVSLSDKWHHGSITKSFTATLAAIMVQEGLIQWETTLGEVFPEQVPQMVSGWSGVTLKQLLANSSGAPGNLNENGIWTRLWNFNGTPEQGRQLLLEEVTSFPLKSTPGSGYEYSNAGFSLGGAMLEAVAGQPWEDLLREKLFNPLGMTSAGFGVPATPRHLDHPVGHSGNVGNPTIWDPGTNADNPPAIGPAATVHASILDLALYAQMHLLGSQGEPGLLLTPQSFEMLHTPAFGHSYALGWFAVHRTWAEGIALNHNGSNTQWFTNIWIAPNINWAVITCTNFGGNNAFNLSDQIFTYLLNNYGP